MTGTHKLHHYSHLFVPEYTMKLTSSASEQNVCFTYVCLVNAIKPNENIDTEDGFNNTLHAVNAQHEELTLDDEPIQVERSKALHELIESHRKEEKISEHKGPGETDSSTPYPPTISGDDSEVSENDESNFIQGENPNILKLTKMKWLTEDQEGGLDSSSPSLSPTTSSVSSDCSKESEDNLCKHDSFDDKYLSTIIRLDKEHNMFGLSNIAIVGTKPSKLKRRADERPVFHQTAIVQVCCRKKCCRHKSNTDLPASLKCAGCRGCCSEPPCSICFGPCGPPVNTSANRPKSSILCIEATDDPPCNPYCISCPKGSCICKIPCVPSKCTVECSKCFGMKVSVNRKQKYEPMDVELTPRSSSVLQKPISARSCHHWPQCVPPSSCFPYLMPCFWPARPSAPCSVPARCFHNPPCPAPRKHQCPRPPEVLCPRTGPCEDSTKKTKCTNDSCIGTEDKTYLTEDTAIDRNRKKKKMHIACECAVPTCTGCFVTRPEKRTQGDDTADVLKP